MQVSMSCAYTKMQAAMPVVHPEAGPDTTTEHCLILCSPAYSILDDGDSTLAILQSKRGMSCTKNPASGQDLDASSDQGLSLKGPTPLQTCHKAIL